MASKIVGRWGRAWALLTVMAWIWGAGQALAADGELQKVTVQLRWLHQFQFAGYYAAKEKGFYQQAGLDVTLVEGGPGRDPIGEVLAGRAQYGAASNEALVARLHGQPIKVLAVIFQESPSILLALKYTGINSPMDLIGKRVMLIPGTGDAELLAMFMKEGISLDNIQRQPSSFNIDDLIARHTDAINAYSTNEPYFLDRRGLAASVIRPATYGIHFYGDCLITSEAQIKSQPEQVKAFRAATLQGWQYAMDHPEEIIEIILTRYSQKKTREHLRFEAAAMRELIQPEMIQMGHMNPGRWRHMADTLASLGMVPKDYKLAGLTYNPEEGVDLTAYMWAGGVGLGVLLLVGVVAVVLARFNRRLRREVAERARAEERFTTLAANVPGAIIQVQVNDDGSRQYIYLSPRCSEFFGVGPEEVIARKLSLNWHPEDRQRITEQMMANRDAGLGHNLVGRIILPDGQEKWVNLTASPSAQSDGHLRYDGFILDITQRKLAEMEYLASEHKIKAMSQAVDDALIMLDSRGRVLFWNPAAERLFGYAAAEAMGMDFHDMAAPEALRPKARHGLEEFGRSGQGPVLGTTTEIMARDRQGRQFPVEVTLSSFQADGEWFAVGTVRDISARKQAEDELRASQARYRLLLEASPDPITVYDMQGKVTYINPAFRQAFGWTQEELAGRSMEFVPPHEQENTQRAVAGILRGETVFLESQRLTKDGRLLDMQIKAAGLTDAEGKLVGSIVNYRDISERKRAEQALAKSQRLLQRILDTSPLGVAISSSGLIRFANPRYTELVRAGVGDDPQQIYVDPRDRQRMLDALAQSEVAPDLEMKMLGPGGEVRDILATFLKTEYEGKPGILGWLMDITQRKRDEQALKASERRMAAIIDSLPDPALVVDNQGRVVSWNRAMERLTAIPKAQMVGKGDYEYALPFWGERRPILIDLVSSWNDEMAQTYQGIHQDGDCLVAEAYHAHMGDGGVYLVGIATVLHDAHGGVIGAIETLHDITVRKRAEALMVEKEVAEEAAARAEEARAEAEEAQRQLQHKLVEIERFNRLALGREERILDLKRQANTLATLAGFDKPYDEHAVEVASEEPPKAEDQGQLDQEMNSDHLAEILAVGQFQDFLRDFCESTGITAAIIDTQGKVLAAERWQRACTDFHRQNQATCARCIESDVELATQLREGKPYTIYRCKNGLTDAASPVIIAGKHLANVFVGQFFTDQPDTAFFLKQAMEVGFDPNEYLAAIADVPVVKEERLPSILGILVGMARMVTYSYAERQKAKQVEEIMVRRAEDIARERAAALSLAEDAEQARKEIEQYKGRLELLVEERTEELKASEERSRLLLDSAGEGIFGVDSQGRLTFVNPAALEMLGFVEADLLGQEVHALIRHKQPDGEDYPPDDCPMIASCSDGTTHHVTEEVLWRKDGTSFPVEYSSTPISKEGQVVGAVVTFRDITERLAAQQALARERALFLDILEKCPLSIAITTQGTIRFVNPIVHEKFGYKVGDPAPRVYVRESDRDQLLEILRKEGIVRNREVQMWSVDSRKLDMLVTFVPISFEGEQGVLAWLIDITERKRAEEEMRQYLQDLERFNRLTLGREERMIELKREINALLEKSGKAGKYKIVEDAELN